MFRIFLVVSLLAGLAAGLLLTGVQQWRITPLIMKAEVLEEAAAGEHAAHGHEHGHEAHAHDEAGWAPADGVERISFTLLSNVLAGVGFGLLLVAGMGVRGHRGWLPGLGWGLAGYAAFFLAPSLGLHPKVPGTAGAPLMEQQLWWIFTVLSTLGGLALLAFGRSLLWRGMAPILILVPHLVGAPLPEQAASLAPPALRQDFIVATGLANALFWVLLGSLSGRLLQHFLPPAGDPPGFS